jgi:hypothetical protein
MSARKAKKNNVASERIFLACAVFYGDVPDMRIEISNIINNNYYHFLNYFSEVFYKN